MKRSAISILLGMVTLVACQSPPEPIESVEIDYCSIEGTGSRVDTVRPAEGEPPIDDVNWFARPVPNRSAAWVVGFASHDQNYLYDLGSGERIKIPDRSDAVATPDGLYMTVPSYYTSDEYIRFYDATELLGYLERGEDALDVEPVYIHEHEDLRKVYYQSTGIVNRDGDRGANPNGEFTRTYRVMFSGTSSESGFRIVDYAFSRRGGDTVNVAASEPMKLCPEIKNDLNTPFISKDARYVASYTSSSEEREYSPGSSLKLYEIVSVSPDQGTTSCKEVIDFGFAAGKADFSFDGSQLTFHISKGGYLTPFINGGLPADTTTDVVVVDLDRDAKGDITGYRNMRRLTTSLAEGVGNYFPAFLPDGNLFYLFNAVPKESEKDKRFYFKVTNPIKTSLLKKSFFDSEASRKSAAAIGSLWYGACAPNAPAPKDHETPWIVASLNPKQCSALVEEKWQEGMVRRETLEAFCANAS